MKAVEFKSTVAPGGQIAIPPEIARELPTGEQLHVVIMWEASDSDQAWRSAGRRRFEAAYSPEDVIYERSKIGEPRDLMSLRPYESIS